MKEVMKTVEDCNVYFNIEVVNRFEQFMINTAAEGVDYCKRVGSRHCKVLLDMFHMNIEEDSIYESIVPRKKAFRLHSDLHPVLLEPRKALFCWTRAK